MRKLQQKETVCGVLRWQISSGHGNTLGKQAKTYQGWIGITVSVRVSIRVSKRVSIRVGIRFWVPGRHW